MTETSEYKISIDGKRQVPEPCQRQRLPIKVNRILVPTDLTKESDRAIEFGLVLARLFEAHLTLLHVYQDPFLRGRICARPSRLRSHAKGPDLLRENARDDCRSIEKGVPRLR